MLRRMLSAITISLVPEARGGPFVYWDDLEAGIASAARHGFDAVELFLPSADAVSADILRALPVSKFFEAMTVRLDPVKSADAHLTIAFQFTDTAQSYGVEVRRGVAQVHETLPPKADATLKLTTQTLNRLIARQTTFPEAMKAGEVKAEGNLAALPKFLSFFDPPSTAPPVLTLR